MITVIAEKPSVAREIALLLGATEKKEGYLTGNGYFVTWAFGHLVGLAMPEDYGITGFQKSSLPILPNPFLLMIRKVKKDKIYSTDMGALAQIKIIEDIIERSEKIIAATDAGREGELIFRYIYQYLKCSKPFERLWISSLTEKAIKKGFENLKPGSDFDGLFKAAQSRSRADWLVGINTSQALSIAAGDGVYSLGRVQTPTLALICRRYLENKNFSVKQYWQIELQHTKDFIDFKSLSKNKWENDIKGAQDTLKSIKRNDKTATVVSAETINLTEQPPLLFDLTGLQKEANIKLNLSAQETLNVAQILYEKKLITYPRTGSKYIPEDVWDTIPGLVSALQDNKIFRHEILKVKLGHLNKRIVNDLRVTDHHGLLTTEKIPSSLPAKENAVYNMIALRLLEAVSQPCIKETTKIILEVLHLDFILHGSRITEPGWRSIRGSFYEKEAPQELPDLKKGDQLKIKNGYVLEKKTVPQVLYTEAGILSAMETAGQDIEKPEGSSAMQSIGLGTPATRSGIIETLFARNYIERKKRSLLPTQKGLQVYELVKDKKIADAAMTAQWEGALKKIENNEADAEVFQKEMETYTSCITYELMQTSTVQNSQRQLLCPKCKNHNLIIRDKIAKCKDEACNWFQYRSICGVHLSLSEIEKLVLHGRTTLISGMRSKAGKEFSAYIVLNEQGGTFFEFGTRQDKK
jgi:DNA topoisomerase-3